MSKISNETILINRIYPAIQNCVSNRYKIISGLFFVYAFIASALNTNKEIINQNVALFAGWVFTFFVLHNAVNYWFNAKDQYKKEGKKLSFSKRFSYFMRAEGLFTVPMLLIIWFGYFCVLQDVFAK